MAKTLYLELNNPTKEKSNVIIYGTDQFGIITKRTIDRDESSNFKVIAFIDNREKINIENLHPILWHFQIPILIICLHLISQ